MKLVYLGLALLGGVVGVDSFLTFGQAPLKVGGTSGLRSTCMMSLMDTEIEYFDPRTREDSPTPGAEVRELPVFPLNVVTVPTGKSPLHIFEMRYRQMMNNIAKTDNRFGIIMYDSQEQKMATYGTVVEVVERNLLTDGRQLLMNLGRERFRVLKIVTEKPYLVCQVEVGLKDDVPAEGGEAEETSKAEMEVWNGLQEVVRLSNKVYDQTKISMSEDVAKLAPSDEAAPGPTRSTDFSFCVMEMLDIPPKTKQLMLQSTKTADRLAFQAELLAKAQKYLAAQASLKDTLG